MRPELGRAPWALLGLLLAGTTGASTEANGSSTLASHQILPREFRPSAVFRNTNMMRHTNVEKGFVRETINIVVENIDQAPQQEYFMPFDANRIGRVGGLGAKDKNNPDRPGFRAELVEYDPYSPTQFYRITLPQALAPQESLTLSISYHVVLAFEALPALIKQQDKQFLVYRFSKYVPSAYETVKQKTKLKLPTTNVPDYSSEPERQGSMLTYGPYDVVPAGAVEDATVRYEFTKPVVHGTLLERDVEVSQWGGNLALEERYWLTNQGAHLAEQFSRVEWAMTKHFPTASSALSALRFPMQGGSADAYFTDDIGNVSTSHFRTSDRSADLEITPRYPIFGGWKYNFRIGWNNRLSSYLRKTASGPRYVLRVPFLEGPRLNEGIAYGRLVLTFVLPEGASNVAFDSPVPIVSSQLGLRKTFMDSVGRTTLTLTAINVVDEVQDRDILVTYDYPLLAAFRKPLIVFIGALSVFATAWAIGNVDVSISKRVV